MGQESSNTGGFREYTAPPCDFGYVEASMDMIDQNPVTEERKSSYNDNANKESRHQIQNQVFYHQIPEDIGDLNRMKNKQ